MQKIAPYYLIFLLNFIFSGCNSDGNKSLNNADTSGVEAEKLDADSKEFLKQAAQSLIFDIEMANFAEENAKEKKVRIFASNLSFGSTRVYNELKKLAAQNHLLLPVEANKEQLSIIDNLKLSNRQRFDRFYLSSIIQNQTNTLELFRKAGEIKHPAINNFVLNRTPDLKKQHFSSIKLYNSLAIN
ncbi:MAG: DUF4142 domain-containing protein [Daejeonella sp.]